MGIVLVVDDERHIVRLITVSLERAGYEVVTAFDGEEAWGKVLHYRPSVVITDIMMPKLDGYDLLSRIRNAKEVCETRVMFLTAKAQDRDVFEGYGRGVDIYLTKPFSPVEVLTFISKLTSGPFGGEESLGL